MIATKQEYDIQGIELEANISAETVWATISLKDQHKLVVGSYYRPPDSGSDSGSLVLVYTQEGSLGAYY